MALSTKRYIDPDDPPPSIQERYGVATHSSHLRVESRSRGSADYLMAAAWSHKLAPLMFRLREEFDAVRASVKLDRLNRAEYLLILSRLKALKEAKDKLGSEAITLATRTLYMKPDTVVLAIAGRVLDVWLDPRCHSCDARGFNGGTHRGERTITCRACRGSGERRANLGDDSEDRRFARLLLQYISEASDAAEARMKGKLRDTDAIGA